MKLKPLSYYITKTAKEKLTVGGLINHMLPKRDVDLLGDTISGAQSYTAIKGPWEEDADAAIKHNEDVLGTMFKRFQKQFGKPLTFPKHKYNPTILPQNSRLNPLAYTYYTPEQKAWLKNYAKKLEEKAFGR